MGKLKSSSAGFSLIEIMVSMGLLSLVFLIVFTLLKDANKSLTEMNTTAAVNFLRSWVIQELNRPQAWINTYTANKKFECITLGTPACPASWTPFSLYDSRNTVMVNSASNITPATATPTHNTNGFTLKGTTCTGAPSAACPIRLNLEWRVTSVSPGNHPLGAFSPGGASDFISYYPSNIGIATGYFGVIPASVPVQGYFTIWDDSTTASKNQKIFINTDFQDFKLYKEVP